MAAKSTYKGALLFCQNKPFSFLAPSTNPKGNKHFAKDLLTLKNMRVNLTIFSKETCLHYKKPKTTQRPGAGTEERSPAS